MTLANVNFSLSPSYFTGRTDADIGECRHFELNHMDIEHRPDRAFFRCPFLLMTVMVTSFDHGG